MRVSSKSCRLRLREDRVSATKQHRNDPRIRRNEEHNGMSPAPVYIDQSIDQLINMFYNNGVGSDVAQYTSLAC